MTTLAPTTIGLTTPFVSTFAPTTPPPLDIDADPIIIEVRVRSYFTYFPPAAINPALNSIASLTPLEIEIEITGEMLHQWIEGTPIEIEIELEEEDVEALMGEVIDLLPIEISINVFSGYFILERPKCNWVKWSKVGVIDFTIDESNVAGERPLDWPGCVYKILKLGKSLAVYGENGVSILTPVENAYGMQTIYRIGLISLDAAAGTEEAHFFIDVSGRLFKLSSEGLQDLGYTEFFEGMVNLVMSIDPVKQLLYICDGVKGFVYNMKDGGLGVGPTNITGIGVRGSNYYVTAPDTIEMPLFEICTDIYDMGTRKPKTIQLVEVGTDLTEHLELLIEYRIDNRSPFKESEWHLVNPDGIAYCPCYGVEFRFRIRSFIHEWFKIDRLKINGVIHNVSHRDYLSMTLQQL